MKKAFILLTTACLLTAISCSARAEQKESAYDRVMRTGTIKCGYAMSPSYMMKDPNTGKMTGTAHDIMEAVGVELGLKIEWTEEVGWGNFIEGLRAGRYDEFCGLQWPDEARTRFQTLSDPVTYSYLNAYVRADDHRFDGHLERVNDPAIKIPAIDGDVTVKMARTGFPKAGILTLPQTATASEMLMAVQTKKADIVFLDNGLVRAFEEKNPGILRKVEKVDVPFIFSTRYGFNSGEMQLRDMVNVAIRTLLDNGRVAAIVHEYSPNDMVARKNY